MPFYFEVIEISARCCLKKRGGGFENQPYDFYGVPVLSLQTVIELVASNFSKSHNTNDTDRRLGNYFPICIFYLISFREEIFRKNALNPCRNSFQSCLSVELLS